MNTIDSKEANEELVCIWNAIEERAEDQEIIDYARAKRKQLTDLREAKRQSDEEHKSFDKAYMKLIDKEVREVQRYAKKNRLK